MAASLRESVQQARFPRVGGAKDGDREPIAQPLPQMPVGKRVLDFLAERGEDRPDPLLEIAGQIFVGEIDRRLQESERPRQPGRPVPDPPGKTPIQLLERLTPLGRRLRRDQVGESLDLGQVQAAIVEGAARKLPRLRQSQSGNPP